MDDQEKFVINNALEMDVKAALTRLSVASEDPDTVVSVINEWLFQHMGESWSVKETI